MFVYAKVDEKEVVYNAVKLKNYIQSRTVSVVVGLLRDETPESQINSTSDFSWSCDGRSADHRRRFCWLSDFIRVCIIFQSLLNVPGTWLHGKNRLDFILRSIKKICSVSLLFEGKSYFLLNCLFKKVYTL